MARLDGVQRAMANQPLSSLVTLENHLLKELEVVLEQEKDLWALKSRINWMILGDRNTSFFHISTLARRKRNLITAIKNEVGEWLTEEREVASHIREGFLKLYTTSQEAATWEINHNQRWQAKLSNEEKGCLSRMVTDEEIRTALWSLKAFKSPGPDGLHAGFFQRFWLIVGGLVRDEVHTAFRDRFCGQFIRLLWVCGFLDGLGLLCGSTLFGLGHVLAAINNLEHIIICTYY
nr:uncharacterized protein LOC112027993 isoform X3 [Quercus suber]XP_023916396.1 uncharacterized protein LOC112027993 isoform X3 [Quercus suber]